MLRTMGAALSLPLLEAMQPTTALAVTPKRPKLRVGYLYIPNGVADGAWQPTEVSANGELLALNKWMAPLEPFRRDLIITENVWTPRGNGHSAGTATWLTGGSYEEHEISAGGISVDQQIARAVGKETMLPSLELSMRGEGFFSNDLPRNALSWTSPNVPASREVEPRHVYDRMFRRSDEGMMDQSVVDLVLEQSRSLKRRLGKMDQQKIDEYLESVRSVERRIEFADTQASRLHTGKAFPIDVKRPAPGVPADHGEYMRLMLDLMVLAFWSDATRVCTFMLDHGQSNRYFDFIDGVKGTWHALSHWKDFDGKTEDDDGITSWSSKQEKREQYNRVTRWHHEQVAHLFGRMKEIDEGNGTLLDNSMILYGSSLADGHEHDEENLPLLVAGGGSGTIKTGRKITYRDNTSLSRFHLATMKRMGLDVDRFAESREPMEELAG